MLHVCTFPQKQNKYFHSLRTGSESEGRGEAFKNKGRSKNAQQFGICPSFLGPLIQRLNLFQNDPFRLKSNSKNMDPNLHHQEMISLYGYQVVSNRGTSPLRVSDELLFKFHISDMCPFKSDEAERRLQCGK